MTAPQRNPEEIFYKAIEIADAAERAAYLDKACGMDRDLRHKVEALLRAHERAGSFLSPPAGECVTLDGPARIDGPGTVIGRYELLELIGEGGMGLVYLAEQKEPVRRKVAFKIIKPGMDSRQVIARFEAERQTLAVLDHPNIAHVFDAGCTDTGRPYFVMEHVRGLPITSYCDQNKLTIEQRLRLFEQVCEAVHHAHQKGIIHRDLKPSNILVSAHEDRATPKIIDFGIAKAITSPLTDKTYATLQGQLLGTPEYMSPEQVDLATQDIDTRSDIYSLGVVLYELLAGVLPFESESFVRAGLAEIQRTIREIEPASPSNRLTSLGEKAHTIAASRGTQVVPLARRLHRELEWIPLKAMRKDRCRRYKSASEMADDVRNYLHGNPLLAGPETAMYRVQKFVRKHAGSVATVALVAAAIVLGLVVSTAMYFQAEEAHRKEAVARNEEGQARIQAEQAKQAEQEHRKLAEDRAEDLRRALYANRIQLADTKYREGDIGQVRELLAACPNDLRGWEWNRMAYIADQSVMTAVAYRGRVNSLILSSDGRQMITGGWSQAIKIWDVPSLKEISSIPTGDRREIRIVVLSPDGTRIASGDDTGKISIWDRTTRKRQMTLWHPSYIYSLAFSPDGKHLASGSNDNAGQVKVWDVATGTEVAAIQAHGRMGVLEVAFSRDGKILASAGNWENTVKIWDASTWRELTALAGQGAISFGPSGQLATAGAYSDVYLWDVATGRKVSTLRGHGARIVAIAFSADGKYIATGSNDNTVRLWDASTGDAVRTFRGHEYFVTSLVFTPDGSRIVSGSWDGTVRIWDLSVDRESVSLTGHESFRCSIAYSPDGRQIVSSGENGVVTLWDLDHGTMAMTLHGTGNYSAVFSPDGKRIAGVCSGTKGFKAWDTATGDEVMSVGGKGARGSSSTAFSPDGRYVATGGTSGQTVKVWDAGKGTEVAALPVNHEDDVRCLAFSPDGRIIASGGWDPNIKLWDWAGRRELLTLRGQGVIINSVSFSPDGTRVVSSCQEDLAAKLWDAMTGTELMTFKHADIVSSAAFSPDGTRIVTSCRDGKVRVWDVATGAELLSLQASSFPVRAAFSPDGKTIAGCTTDKRIVLWESAPPAGGYGARKDGAHAYRIVDELYTNHANYDEVVRNLEEDTTIDGPVRELALRIADSRRWEEAGRLIHDAWPVVSSPTKNMDTYRAALEKAQKADSLTPNKSSTLNTLGVAQYRVGLYEDALKTLAEADKMRADVNDTNPADVAFIAMSLHRLGRSEEARAALDRLQDLLKNERFADDLQAKNFLAEAEGLIDGVKK